MSNIIGHGLVTKRVQTWRAINFVFLIVPPVIAIIAAASQRDWRYLGIALFMILGLPITDYQHPTAKLKLWIQKEQIELKGGVVEAPPLLRRTKPEKRTPKPTLTWRDTATIVAAFPSPRGNINIPFLMSDGYLTAILVDEGVPEEELEKDAGDRYYGDAALSRHAVLAICKTRQPHLVFGTSYLKEGADETEGYEYNIRRPNPDMKEAIGKKEPAERYDEVDIDVADHAMEVHDAGYDNAGKGVNITWIEMPFPTNRAGKRINLGDASKVRSSDLMQTVMMVMQGYAQSNITVSMVETEDELNNLIRRGLCLREQRTIDIQGQRDRELIKKAEKKGKVIDRSKLPGAKRNGWRPRTTSFGEDKEHDLGYMVIDGTCIAAGHMTEITNEVQTGGYMSGLLKVPTGISFAFTTIIEAPLVGYEKVRAKEKERWTKVAQGLLSYNDGLSTPEKNIQVDQIVEFRKMLAESSNRAGIITNIIVVMSDSVEALRFDWDDVVASLTSAYQFEQVYLPAQIMYWTKAVFGILPRKFRYYD